MLGVTYHGGFEVGDIVQVRHLGRWSEFLWAIKEFNGQRVVLKCRDCEAKANVALSDIRHPHLVKEGK